jgi:hypothetical protein
VQHGEKSEQPDATRQAEITVSVDAQCDRKRGDEEGLPVEELDQLSIGIQHR